MYGKCLSIAINTKKETGKAQILPRLFGQGRVVLTLCLTSLHTGGPGEYLFLRDKYTALGAGASEGGIVELTQILPGGLQLSEQDLSVI